MNYCQPHGCPRHECHTRPVSGPAEDPIAVGPTWCCPRQDHTQPRSVPSLLPLDDNRCATSSMPSYSDVDRSVPTRERPPIISEKSTHQSSACLLSAPRPPRRTPLGTLHSGAFVLFRPSRESACQSIARSCTAPSASSSQAI